MTKIYRYMLWVRDILRLDRCVTAYFISLQPPRYWEKSCTSCSIARQLGKMSRDCKQANFHAMMLKSLLASSLLEYSCFTFVNLSSSISCKLWSFFRCLIDFLNVGYRQQFYGILNALFGSKKSVTKPCMASVKPVLQLANKQNVNVFGWRCC